MFIIIKQETFMFYEANRCISLFLTIIKRFKFTQTTPLSAQTLFWFVFVSFVYFSLKSCFKLIIVCVSYYYSISVWSSFTLTQTMLMLGLWLIIHSYKLICWCFWKIMVMCIIVHYLYVVDDPNESRKAWKHSNHEDGLSAQSLPLSAQTVLWYIKYSHHPSLLTVFWVFWMSLDAMFSLIQYLLSCLVH